MNQYTQDEKRQTQEDTRQRRFALDDTQQRRKVKDTQKQYVDKS